MSDSTPSPNAPSNVPNPDPSVRASEVMLREIGAVRELAKSWVDGLQILIEGRFNTVEEKFNSVGTQFRERDDRTRQTAMDSKLAIDAALQAAKEAVGKSETSTTKQIDDIKERMNKVEQAVLGAAGRQAGVGATTGAISQIIAGIAALIAIAAAVVAYSKN